MKRLRSAALLIATALACLCTACGSGGSGGSAAGAVVGGSTTGDPATDKLAQVLARGTLVMFTDPNYPPSSMAVQGAKRPADTKCLANQLTGAQITGYDAETSKAVAKALGVEPCFVQPSWTEVTAGSWDDRWDIAWGSGAIDQDRMTRLYVTQPNYTTPASVYVRKDSTYHHLSELGGTSLGACSGCTMEQYLRGTLVLPGTDTTRAFAKPKVVVYDNEVPGLHAVAAGKIDGFLCSEPIGDQAIADGLPLRKLQEPAYQSYKTGYVDKASALSSAAFVERVNQIVGQLQTDGTLKDLSMKFLGTDYATPAARFDFAKLDQQVS